MSLDPAIYTGIVLISHQLFFVDSGPSNALIPAADDTSASESESEDALHPAAWEDSDDERITVSLASHARLRKLRTTEADDIVNGKEYSRRLRRQYERLYPVPEWANPAATKKSQSRKKRRLSDGSASSSGDDANANEMEIDSDADEDSSNDTFSTAPLAQLLQDAGSLVSAHQSKSQLGKRKLQPEVLSIQRLKDVGDAQPSSVDSLSFHPTHPILLSSGPSKTLFLHQINSTTTTSTSSEPHPLLTTLHIRNVPLMNTVFTPSGTEIYLAGRRRYFHIWSLANGAVTKVPAPSLIHTDLKTTEHFRLSPCGRFLGLIGSGRKGGGSIHILSTTTSQVQESIRVDGRGGIADFAWWSDGEGMVIANHNGEVSEYDRVQRRIVARWIDEGAVGTTTITLGGRSGRSELGGDRWVAVGSSSGIVNIYDRRTWLSPSTSTSTSSNSKDSTNAFSIPHAPKPHRALDNLTTPISHLHFAPDGHILVMASRWKRNALRVGMYIVNPLLFPFLPIPHIPTPHPRVHTNIVKSISQRRQCSKTGRRQIRLLAGLVLWLLRHLRTRKGGMRGTDLRLGMRLVGFVCGRF